MKSRGALSNPVNRFFSTHVEADSEHLGAAAGSGDDWQPQKLHTRVSREQARTLITRNASPDVPFNLSINPYRGCEHGCIYCYARPSHAYLDLSPGLDFESRLFAKVNAAWVLERELARPGYRCEVLALGANTDAYQPVEKTLGITRQLLEVMLEFRQPVAIITKGTGILRDLDLLSRLARQNLVTVTISVTSLDPSIKRSLEPRAASPAARLSVIRSLREAGIPVSVLMAPIIPRITDHEIESVLKACAAAGASGAGYILLRLPLEVRPLFNQWLETHFPERAAAVMSLMRQCRGGHEYRGRFGERMKGTGPVAELIRQRFEKAVRRLRLGEQEESRSSLDTHSFRVPPRTGDQLSLF